jgi:endoglucanase
VRRILGIALFLAASAARSASAAWDGLRINDREYFDRPGLSVLVFSDVYPEGHQGGVEIIQHDRRVAACGDLRLEPTPGQWDPLPVPGPRVVDPKAGRISVSCRYPDPGIDYTVTVTAQGEGFRVDLDLDRPLPEPWVGRVGFNLELFPGDLAGRSWRADGAFGIFPRQSNGPAEPDGSGGIRPVPLASGRDVTVAPEDPERRLSVSSSGPILLYDGRLTDLNGWFVLRSLVPAGATKRAVSWTVTPNRVDGWRREPVVGYSQIGYHPDAEKRAVIELDPSRPDPGRVRLLRVEPDGTRRTVFSSKPDPWKGRFLRYAYAVWNFSSVTEPGVYVISCSGAETAPFPIARDVFMRDVWQPTLETFLPMQMCHVAVRDGFRTWHGACHLDDALQAPAPHAHFDGYRQGAETETPYAALEHVPFLDRGGWHDAGDDDLAAGSQASAVWTLALTREEFPGTDIDQTRVAPEDRVVYCHRPDGVPDFDQQIAHGVENLLSGYRAAGHGFMGIISSSIGRYVHCGDPSVSTDNRIHDASLDTAEVRGDRSGRMDDRWVFTNRNADWEFRTAAALAAASRVLAATHPALSAECRKTAEAVWRTETGRPGAGEPERGPAVVSAAFAAVELFKTSGDSAYLGFLIRRGDALAEQAGRAAWCLCRIWPDLDPELRTKISAGMAEHAKRLEKRLSENPYGVPFSGPVWGIGWNLQTFAMEQYYLGRIRPDLFPAANVLRAVNWVLGCHPGSNTSFVSGVGGRSVTTAYGFNRADASCIPGGGVSGTALIRPDFPELKEPFPFLWQQTEYVLSGAASWMFCALAADRLENPAR